jgi:4-hydroxybenzoate polyprenyltransferase
VALAGKLGDAGAWLNVGLAFLAIGFLASATYLVNDLSDLADDRRHWSKRNRPLASGRMSIPVALLLVPAFLVIAAALGLFAGPAVFSVLALYGATTLFYSFKLKRIPIVDVMTLASLFTLRLLLGVVAIGAALSPWLFVFSMALFFSISLAKRHVEVVRLRAHGMEKSAGRGYDPRDEPFLLALGVGSALSSVVLLSLYLSADAFRAAFYGAPQFLWFAPAIILLWLSRIWLLSQRGELDDDPVAFALKDRPSLMLGAALGLAFFAAAFGQHLPWLT